MDKAWSRPDINEKCSQKFNWNIKEGDHLADKGIDGKIKLKYIIKLQHISTWIYVTQNRGQWWSLELKV